MDIPLEAKDKVRRTFLGSDGRFSSFFPRIGVPMLVSSRFNESFVQTASNYAWFKLVITLKRDSLDMKFL